LAPELVPLYIFEVGGRGGALDLLTSSVGHLIVLDSSHRVATISPSGYQPFAG
jgi:hypothetical protein